MWHRDGNRAADRVASGLAAECAAPVAWRARRAAALEDLGVCQRLLAAVELAVLQAARRPASGFAAR
eukprot:6450986-Lingulodinium_polyedra.AAC.1